MRGRRIGKAGEQRIWKAASVVIVIVFSTSMIVGALPSVVHADAPPFNVSGSLPDAGKKINQLIWPSFGYPAIQTRGSQMTLEWDWRKSDPAASMPDFGDVDDPGSWTVWVTTSVAANVQHYNGASNDENQWYNYQNPSDPYGYGTYQDPVHSVINTRELEVKSITRGPSTRWPEIFGQADFTVDKVTVEIPADVPYDLFDLHITAPVGGITDQQPHALNVIKEYNQKVKILQISDTHVYGEEIQIGKRDLTGMPEIMWPFFGITETPGMEKLEFNSFELREPRPGTPNRTGDAQWGYDQFPLDKDGDGKTNEGAIYLQEELQAINLINPDFVVFTGDSVFTQADWNTYPKADAPGGGSATGDVGSEYRFEMPWWYDELLALDVPIFCVPGNHDGFDKEGWMSEGGLEHDDGQELWQDLFGPLYYSWDYGNDHFLAINSMDWDKGPADPNATFADVPDRNGNRVDVIAFLANLALQFGWDSFNLNQPDTYVLSPHKWLGEVRGGGDVWRQGSPPSGSGLRWDPGNIASYTGQLGWIRDDLASHSGSSLRGAFLHHDPLKEVGSDPEMWNDSSEFGMIYLPAGHGMGSQSLIQMMKTYDVAFWCTGHAHSDWVSTVPWYDGTGQVRAINTDASEPPVDGESLMLSGSDSTYGGYRLLTLEGGQLTSWGFAGEENDANSRNSIPGWAGLTVGATSAVNDYTKYRNNRPVLQWMEQDQAKGAISPGDDGTFSEPLPLNETGPYNDVTCRVKNTLNQTNARLDLTDCRIEFPMAKPRPGMHYAVENGRVLEEYDTDDSDVHMVVVLTDEVSAGSTVPVRVHEVSTPTAPIITSVDPPSGPPGTQVTITGNNFGDTRGAGKGKSGKGASYVSFNGVAATEYASWSNTRIVCTVPEGATTGPVVVVVNGVESNTDIIFTVTYPTWYLAEGSCAWGFSTYITIENPNSAAVTAKITYVDPHAYPGGKGGVLPLKQITLPPQSQTTINPRDDLGYNTDFSTMVECTEGKTIAVDRTMTWTGPGAPSPEAHSSIGTTSPSEAWYLPEGSTNWGFETWTLVQNPNATEASVKLTYMTEDAGAKVLEKKIPAFSRATYNMASDIGSHDSSIKVTSDVPVIAERSMYRNNRREGACSIGATAPAADYYLAEGTTDWGFTTYVLVQNPNDTAANVTVTYMTGAGPQPQAPFSMPANSRKTIRVNDVLPGKDLSTQVHADKPIIAERAMYWGADKPLGEACHDSIGMDSPHTTFYLPDGQSSDGRETWTLVQNPNSSSVAVEVSYLTPSGAGNVTFYDNIPANSRKTYNMADSGISGRAAVMVRSLTPNNKIMVERAMYWNSRGAGTDTIGGYSD